jgi:hypothetical protein
MKITLKGQAKRLATEIALNLADKDPTISDIVPGADDPLSPTNQTLEPAFGPFHATAHAKALDTALETDQALHRKNILYALEIIKRESGMSQTERETVKAIVAPLSEAIESLNRVLETIRSLVSTL